MISKFILDKKFIDRCVEMLYSINQFNGVQTYLRERDKAVLTVDIVLRKRSIEKRKIDKRETK